jgi:hypothetical protein
MANRRDLKKDIDYLVYEVVSDCFTLMTVKQEENSEEITGIVAEAVNLRNELFARVNNPDGKDNRVIVKSHFTKIRKDLVEGIDKLFEKISVIASK